MKKLFVLIFLLLLTLAVTSPGQQTAGKPNFSGTWIFSAQKSALTMPPPTSMTLKIDQNDPQVRLARTQVFGDQSYKWDLDIVADGQKEVVQDSPQYTANIKMYWEGNSLVLDQKITAPDGTKATDQVTYSLADGGNTLEAVENQKFERVKKPIVNKWVYNKQP
jgi:type 1 fimbria pilin